MVSKSNGITMLSRNNLRSNASAPPFGSILPVLTMISVVKSNRLSTATGQPNSVLFIWIALDGLTENPLLVNGDFRHRHEC